MVTKTEKTNTKAARPIAEGYRTVTAWIIVKGAVQLIDYVKAASGAEEIARVVHEDGTIGSRRLSGDDVRYQGGCASRSKRNGRK